MELDFREFPKIPRLSRQMIVTEKIDGTNGVVAFDDDGIMHVGSRTRWITPQTDNAGFAKWAYEHEEELRVGLGVGVHYGEWWGKGIQRGYGLQEKRFSLFNVSRWTPETLPACCSAVPILVQDEFTTGNIEYALGLLRTEGSHAAPGFMNPEGIVIFHVASGYLFKKTILKDEAPKGAVAQDGTKPA